MSNRPGAMNGPPADRTTAQDGDKEQGGESLRTVVVAFSANLVIAAAKTTVAVITGSAAMVAEAAHSWADTGNEVLARGARTSPPTHPIPSATGG